MNQARYLRLKGIKEIFPELYQRFEFQGNKPIGERSGFGAVWKAFDTWLERYVAIKISNCSDSEIKLKDEISFCRDIDGHTVRIYDYYVSGDWEAYSMELLDNSWITLSQFIKKRKFKERDIQHYFYSFEIMRATLLGLADIHGAPYKRKNRIVHSDIKPDNLFILGKFVKNTHSVFKMPVNERMIKFIDLGMSIRRGDLYKGGCRFYQHPLVSDTIHSGHDIYSLSITFLEVLTGELADHSDMAHKSRISKYISNNSSGSRYLDSIALEVVTKCARAANRTNANVRDIIEYLDETIFSVSPMYLIVLKVIAETVEEDLTKSELAGYLFDHLAPYYSWKNKTEARIEQLKWLVTDLHEQGLLIRKGNSKKYFIR